MPDVSLDELAGRRIWSFARLMTHDQWRAAVLVGTQQVEPALVLGAAAAERFSELDKARCVQLVQLLDAAASQLTEEQVAVLRVAGTERFPVRRRARPRLQAALVPDRKYLHFIGLLRYDDSCQRTPFGYYVIHTRDAQELRA